MHYLDAFSNWATGDGHYMALYGCMHHDTLWVGNHGHPVHRSRRRVCPHRLPLVFEPADPARFARPQGPGHDAEHLRVLRPVRVRVRSGENDLARVAVVRPVPRGPGFLHLAVRAQCPQPAGDLHRPGPHPTSSRRIWPNPAKNRSGRAFSSTPSATTCARRSTG